MLRQDTPGTFTQRTPTKGFLGDLVGGFLHMQAHGEDVVAAFLACIRGHRMTEDLAALCIQTYQRRAMSIANFQETRGAAITIQNAFFNSTIHRERVEAASHPVLRAVMRSDKDDEHTFEEWEHIKFQAAARLQAVWRRHLAAVLVERLRGKGKSKSRLHRTFSWSNKSKRSKKGSGGGGRGDGTVKKSAKDILAAAAAEEATPKLAKAVRRSMSFDRFTTNLRSKSKKENGEVGSSAAQTTTPKKEKKGEVKPTATPSKQLLFILLHRGPTGLGLELDATNTVVNMVPGGAAEVQGYFRSGDTIVSVDGVPLRGRLLQDVMDRGKNSYSFDVWRLEKPASPEPAAKANKIVRRAFSFDRKKR